MQVAEFRVQGAVRADKVRAVSHTDSGDCL